MRSFLKLCLLVSIILPPVSVPTAEAAPKKKKSAKKTGKRTRTKPQRRRYIAPHPDSGLGITLGYEATLGNAVTYHWLPSKKLDFYGGIGGGW